MDIIDVSYPPEWDWKHLGGCLEIQIDNYKDKSNEITYLFLPYCGGVGAVLGGSNSGLGLIKIRCVLESELPQCVEGMVSKEMEILLTKYYPEEQI